MHPPQDLPPLLHFTQLSNRLSHNPGSTQHTFKSFNTTLDIDDYDDPRSTGPRSSSSPQHDKGPLSRRLRPRLRPDHPAQGRQGITSPTGRTSLPRLRTPGHPRRRPARRRRPHRRGRDPHHQGNSPGDVLVNSVVDGVESESSPLRVSVAPQLRSFSAAATMDKRYPAICGVACVDADRRSSTRERPREDHRRRVIAFGVIFPVIGQPHYKGWNYTCRFYC